MIRFPRPPEPPDFEATVRAPGRRWLAKRRRRRKRLPDYWSRVLPELREGFRDLCGYSAIYLASPGTVDHFVPISRDRSLAYEWSNYRYTAHWLNASKQDLRPDEILDPFEVGDDWFEIILPSCQLVVTDACPPERRAAANVMLTRLKLGHGEQVIRYRLEWLHMYRKKQLTLSALEKIAPLLARAIRKEQEIEKRARKARPSSRRSGRRSNRRSRR